MSTEYQLKPTYYTKTNTKMFKDKLTLTLLIVLIVRLTLVAQIVRDSSTPKAIPATSYSYPVALELATNYGSIFPDSALLFSKIAYEIAVKENQVEKQVEALVQISQFEFWTHNYDAAILTAEKAHELLTAQGELHASSLLLYRLAEGYEFTGKPQLGMEYYEFCYSKALEEEDNIMLSKLELKFGNINQVNGHIDKALEFYERAADRLDKNKAGEKQKYYAALQEYLDLALKTEDLLTETETNALCARIESELIAIKMGEGLEHYIAPFYELKIRCLLSVGGTQELQTLPLVSIREMEDITSNHNQLQAKLILYARLALRQNNKTMAKAYTDKSVAIANHTPNLGMKINAMSIQREVYTHLGDYRKVADAVTDLMCFEKELMMKERVDSIDDLEAKLLRKENEHKILLLEKDNEFLEIRNYFFFVASILFGFLFLLVGYFFYRSKQKNKIISAQKNAIVLKNEQLESLSATKDRIFAIIGHDLRKPAIAFRGITRKVNYLLKKKDYNTLDKLGKEIEQDALSLNKLIDNLLNWALVQKGLMPYVPISLQFDNFLIELLESFKPIAEKKQIELEVNTSPDLEVFADPNALAAIIRNLLDNALKYTNSGGKVSINAVGENSVVKIRVTDTGIGMSADKLNDIFLLKNNKSKQGTAGEQGTGLGLHLIYDLVKLNKGMIDVESLLGEGTKFDLVFPAVA